MGRRSRRAAADEVVRADGLAVVRDRGRPTGRLLLQDDMEASYVDLADPRHLEFDYVRRLRDVVEGARDVVHLGGAACSLPRALLAADPASRHEVAEPDAAVLALARRHLGLRRLPGLRVRPEGGRELLARRADASADAVVVDAFVGARVAEELVSLAGLREAARVLRPDGVLAVNVVDVPPAPVVRAVAAGLLEVFADVAALGGAPVVRGRKPGNVVLAASAVPLPLARLQARAAADPAAATAIGRAEVARVAAGHAPIAS